jgi:hypothetical protein
MVDITVKSRGGLDKQFKPINKLQKGGQQEPLLKQTSQMLQQLHQQETKGKVGLKQQRQQQQQQIQQPTSWKMKVMHPLRTESHNKVPEIWGIGSYDLDIFTTFCFINFLFNLDPEFYGIQWVNLPIESLQKPQQPASDIGTATRTTTSKQEKGFDDLQSLPTWKMKLEHPMRKDKNQGKEIWGIANYDLDKFTSLCMFSMFGEDTEFYGIDWVVE